MLFRSGPHSPPNLASPPDSRNGTMQQADSKKYHLAFVSYVCCACFCRVGQHWRGQPQRTTLPETLSPPKERSLSMCECVCVCPQGWMTAARPAAAAHTHLPIWPVPLTAGMARCDRETMQGPPKTLALTKPTGTEAAMLTAHHPCPKEL